MKELKGRVAVVTGGASGIGHALAGAFGAAGMKVVLADIEVEALDNAVADLGRSGVEVIGIPTDVSQADSVDELAARAFETFGTAHVICNNAGVAAGGVTWELPAEIWEWVLGVDLWGVIHGIRAFVPRLVEQGEGHVVNTSSLAGLFSAPGMAPYGAAKHAVVGLSQTLRQDLQLAGSPVGVSVLCPTMTRSRMNESGRNWPARLGQMSADQLQSGHPTTRDSYRERMENQALDPDLIARATLEAVRAGEFWVLPVPGFEERAHRQLTEQLDATRSWRDPSDRG